MSKNPKKIEKRTTTTFERQGKPATAPAKVQAKVPAKALAPTPASAPAPMPTIPAPVAAAVAAALLAVGPLVISQPNGQQVLETNCLVSFVLSKKICQGKLIEMVGKNEVDDDDDDDDDDKCAE